MSPACGVVCTVSIRVWRLRSTVTFRLPALPRNASSQAASSPHWPMDSSMARPWAFFCAHCSALMAPTPPSSCGARVPSTAVRVPRAVSRTAPLWGRPAASRLWHCAWVRFSASGSSPAETAEQKAASCVSTSLPPRSSSFNVCRVCAISVSGGAGTQSARSYTVSSCTSAVPLRSTMLPRAAGMRTV